MGAYLLRRFLSALPTLIGLSIVTFTIISLAPGDAVGALIGQDEGGVSAAASQEEMRERLGLNDPIPVQYWNWISNVLQGDFGRSLIDNRPITEILRGSASLTLQLTIPALFFGIVLSLFFGILSGRKPYSALDNALSFISITIAGIPGFVVGLGLLYIFAVRIQLFPAGGSRDIGGGTVSLMSRWEYFVLPLVTLSVLEAAQLVRYVRDSIINVRKSDYVQTARSKGLSEGVVHVRHILRNALLPFITVATLQVPGLISGALMVEIVFGWGGIGSRVAVAVGQRDFPVIMGATLLIGVTVVFANLIADVLYAFADPRIRLK